MDRDNWPSTLTARDICSILRICEVAGYNLIHSGQFPVFHVGRSLRIPRDDFFDWLYQYQQITESSSVMASNSKEDAIKQLGFKKGNRRYF